MISEIEASYVLEIMKEVEFPEKESGYNSLTQAEKNDLQDILHMNPEEFPVGFTEKYGNRINEIKTLVFKLHEDAKEDTKKSKTHATKHPIDAKTKHYNKLVTLHMLKAQLEKLEDMYYDIAFHKGSNAQLDSIRTRIHDAKRKIIILKQS